VKDAKLKQSLPEEKEEKAEDKGLEKKSLKREFAERKRGK